MSATYVRSTYGVDFKRGDRVTVAHRRVVNSDSIDTCTGCEWESWDTAPTFEEHKRIGGAS